MTMQEHLAISPSAMASIVEDYLARTDASGWNALTSFDWQAADANRLTEDQRSAVVFITYIEDHLPGYFAEYDRLFPIDDRVEREVYLHNRELYRFTIRWAGEEERHAHALALYQVRSGLFSAEQLRLRLFDEGRKRFRLQHTEPIQVAMYTLVQEKATHLYYRALASAVDEPVLRSILERLARDEAKHFAFFSRLIEAYVQTFGERVIPLLREALAEFKMPLAETLDNYWRIALRISDAAGGYDYTQAFDDLVQVTQRAAGQASWSKSNTVVDFVNAVRNR
jgi:hypothetical protein